MAMQIALLKMEESFFHKSVVFDHSIFNCSHVKVNDCSVPQLKTVMQLLSNMENGQLKTLSRAQATQQVLETFLPPSPTLERESPRAPAPPQKGILTLLLDCHSFIYYGVYLVF